MAIKTEKTDSSENPRIVPSKSKNATESSNKPCPILKPILKPTKSQNINSQQKSNEDQKQKLKEYLNEYNYELVKNSTKTDNLTLNLRKLITDFKEFKNSSQTSLNYLANNLFHINYKDLKSLLLCLPSWNHCKVKAKIIYSLINKFLKNKDEVMRNLKLYYKDVKTVKISTETSNEKETEQKCDDYDDEEDATEIERIISNYDDNPDDKEPTNNCIMDSGMSDHISTVITKLNDFIKTNSISKEFYSKNYLNADIETLDIILMKKSSHEHFDYLYKIEDFLNNKEMMANLIKENNLLIKKKSENQINVENKNSLNTKSGIISNKKDNEIPEVENQNKRLLRNRIKTTREDQKNTVTNKSDNNLPYDTTNVKIESIKLV